MGPITYCIAQRFEPYEGGLFESGFVEIHGGWLSLDRFESV